MRTLSEMEEIITIIPSGHWRCSIHIKYNRHEYQFFSYNYQALSRYMRKNLVNNKVRFNGYTLMGAYMAWYNEFLRNKDKAKCVL